MQLDSSSMTPFLILSEWNRLKIMPLTTLHKADEGSSPGSSSSANVVPHEYLDVDFPMEKWVHIGCEVYCSIIGPMTYSVLQLNIYISKLCYLIKLVFALTMLLYFQFEICYKLF